MHLQGLERIREHDFQERLVERIQSGTPHAEDELVRHYQPGIKYHLWRMSRDPDLSEDLLQETLRLVLEKIKNHEIKQPRALNQFVHHIAKNLFIAHIRKQKRRGDVPLDPAHQDRVDPKASPQELMERAEEINLVRQVVGKLKSKRDRLILFRFYLEQKAKHLICEELGMDGNTFNSVLSRARFRFKALWEASERKNSQK